VIAFLHTTTQHAYPVTNYLPEEHTLNVDSLTFPLAVKDISKFEDLNPTICINVLSFDEKDFCMEYYSRRHDRNTIYCY